MNQPSTSPTDPRRTVLRAAATVCTLGLAGCLGPADDSDEPTPRAETTLSVGNPVCGENGNTGNVEFRDSDTEIAVTGTVTGETVCDDLRLAVFDTADGSEAIVELTVVRGDDCEQCRSEIPFEATIPFPDVYPTEIELVYDTLDGTESITTARRN
jgi:hypothetical protein